MRRTLKLLILFISLFVCVTNVEALKLIKETKTYGGSNYDYFKSVVNSQDGGFVAVGSTYSYDIEGITSSSGSDAIIVKYDKDGNIKWQRSWAGNNYDFFSSVVETKDGGFAVIGTTDSTDFEGIIFEKEHFLDNEAVIVKYDKDGNIKWQKKYGGVRDVIYKSIIEDYDGGYIVVGTSENSYFGGIANKGGYDAIVVKYDENGNIKWQKNYGGNNDDSFESITNTFDGGYIVVGNTSSDDIVGINKSGEANAIIVKYDRNWNLQWQKNYGGNNFTYFYSIVSSPDRGYVAVGKTSSIDINGITNRGRADAIIVKYDENGNIKWQQSYIDSGTIDDTFYDIINDGDNFIVVGNKQDALAPRSIHVDSESSKSGAIIAKYDRYGNVIWHYTYGHDFDGFKTIIKRADSTYLAGGNDDDAVILLITENYEIKYDESDNGSISGINMTTAGDKVELTVTPDNGYILKEIIITDNNGDKIEVVNSNGRYEFVMPSSDVMIKGIFGEPNYQFIEGMEQKYMLDSKNNLRFKSDGLIELLTKVLVNNNELSKEHYILEKGSTIVTIKSDYLNTLKLGKYTLKLEYSNGKVSETTFNIINKVENPATGDNVIVHVNVFIVLIVGILCTNSFIKRKYNKINC